LNGHSQTVAIQDKEYLFDHLEDKYFYKITVKIESRYLLDTYYFMFGRAQRGFFAFGQDKKINIETRDTIRSRYPRTLLQDTQIDSLKMFEQKVIIKNNTQADLPKVTITLSNQDKNHSYTVTQSDEWNPLTELIMILFREIR